MEKIFRSIADWHASGKKTALAVVTSTWGSAPRRAGSLMAINEDGLFEGSVSGGCVEGTVIAEAGALTQTGGTKKLSFTVSSEQAWDVGLACGGQIEILLIGLSGDIPKNAYKILEYIEKRMSGTIEFNLGNGAFDVKAGTVAASLSVDEALLTLPLRPKRRLIIIGAVHIAQHLAPMAGDTGYDVTVIDPRMAFTEGRHFGDARLVEDWPDEFFKADIPDSRTAVVTLTHDPKIDDAALGPALSSDAFYIGCLGSKKTHAARISRLEKAGFGAQQVARIHGPVGLDIGAKTPAEIAISVLAEMTQVLRCGDAV